MIKWMFYQDEIVDYGSYNDLLIRSKILQDFFFIPLLPLIPKRIDVKQMRLGNANVK